MEESYRSDESFEWEKRNLRVRSNHTATKIGNVRSLRAGLATISPVLPVGTAAPSLVRLLSVNPQSDTPGSENVPSVSAIFQAKEAPRMPQGAPDDAVFAGADPAFFRLHQASLRAHPHPRRQVSLQRAHEIEMSATIRAFMRQILLTGGPLGAKSTELLLVFP